MKKLILINLIIMNTLLSAKGILDYPLSDTTRDLYETGQSSDVSIYITWGEHQNLAISPNYFESLGLFSSVINTSRYRSGYKLFKTDFDISFLTPSVEFSENDLFSNFKMRLNLTGLYAFNIKSPLEAFKFSVGPYLKTDALIGYYKGIDNIMAQTYFALNLGVSANVKYQLLKTVRFGLGYSTFVFGIDYGRDGYNKDFIPEIKISNFGNFCDMELTIYSELDISRTESLKLEYNHSVFSVFDENNRIISGENRFGLSFVKKLVR